MSFVVAEFGTKGSVERQRPLIFLGRLFFEAFEDIPRHYDSKSCNLVFCRVYSCIAEGVFNIWCQRAFLIFLTW